MMLGIHLDGICDGREKCRSAMPANMHSDDQFYSVLKLYTRASHIAWIMYEYLYEYLLF